ncbi:MAG: modulator of FtsH protease [Candidatus Sumerlaeota bacterium]|nr:modulator of FtsH protease [Candidatus Sumerlaeota bacterium]
MSFQQMQSASSALPASQASTQDRVAYIRKVYAMFFSGILVYIAAAGLPLLGYFMGIPVLGDVAVMAASLPWWAHLVVLLGMVLLANTTMMMQGINVMVFYLFAAVFGLLSIGLIGYALGVGGWTIVFQALGLTGITMGGLTAYVFITKKDFSFMAGFLTVGLVLSLGAIVILAIAGAMGVDVSLFRFALSIGLVLLFSGYVLYDTSNILHRFSTTMVVPAALALLIDFIILFQNILTILAGSRR